MHEWVDYIKNNCGENGLWQTGFQYGDWFALDKEESADRTGATDKYMIANAYYLYVTELVKKTAEVPGKAEEAEKYGDLYETTLDAFQREYYTETGRIVSETQTGAILSLYFNLAREKDRKRILNTLLTNIANHKNHLAAGFEGTPYICEAKLFVKRYFFRNYITDGPFLIRTEDERLHMLWSTNAKSGYVEAMAHSSNDDLNGEWTIDSLPL